MDRRDRVEAALLAIEPWHDLEQAYRDNALAWVRTTLAAPGRSR